ncbi:MAG: GDSL-type esterase/lipase family protein [Pseudomonadota bacterium]|nr:GDSL-type esterase/lipase family protein [Pseudomonadota bacterium]
MRPRRWGFAVLPLVILLGGGEGALRLAGWPKKDQGRSFTHTDVYWVEKGSLHLEPFPHKETGGTFRVSTDANGLRAPLHAEKKPDGVFRVMTLGCSTTFGWGVDDEQSWPARLEAVLAEAGHPVEVINAGQPGHTSFQGLWLWDKALARYEPDLVLFGYVVQDARMVAYSDHSQALLQQNGDFLKHNLLYQSRLYTGLLQAWNGVRMRQKEVAADGNVHRVPTDEYVANIREFETRAESVGAEFALFGFPLEREGYTASHRAVLRSAAEVLPAPYYDPQSDFERWSASETLFFPQDRGHANAAGLDKIARGMAQFLIAERLIP